MSMVLVSLLDQQGGLAGRDDASCLDAFVSGVAPRKKRLNIEIPADLHARLKADCALREQDITTVLTEMLERRYPSVKGKD